MDALRQWPHTLNVKRVAYNITQATHKGKYNEHHGLKKHAHEYMLTKNGIPEKEKNTEKIKIWSSQTLIDNFAHIKQKRKYNLQNDR